MDNIPLGSESELTIDTLKVGGEFVAVCREFPSYAGRGMDAKEARDSLLRNLQQHMGEGCVVQEQPIDPSPAFETPVESGHPSPRNFCTPPLGWRFAKRFGLSFGLACLLALIAEFLFMPHPRALPFGALVANSIGHIFFFILFLGLPAFVVALMRRVRTAQWPLWNLEKLNIAFVFWLVFVGVGIGMTGKPSRTALPKPSTKHMPRDSARSARDFPLPPMPVTRPVTDGAVEVANTGYREPLRLVYFTPFDGLTLCLPNTWTTSETVPRQSSVDWIRSTGNPVRRPIAPLEGAVVFTPKTDFDGTCIVIGAKAERTITHGTLGVLSSYDFERFNCQQYELAASYASAIDAVITGVPSFEISDAGNCKCTELTATLQVSGEKPLLLSVLWIPNSTRSFSILMTRPVGSDFRNEMVSFARDMLTVEE